MADVRMTMWAESAILSMDSAQMRRLCTWYTPGWRASRLWTCRKSMLFGLPSISTVRASRKMATVDSSTSTEKRKVHSGSAIRYSGCATRVHNRVIILIRWSRSSR